MAWIELHQSVWTHRKTLRLAAELEIPSIYAVGHMAQFWCWAIDNVPNGCLINIPPRVIAIAAGWPGDPDTFCRAALAAGFFDDDGQGNLSIHDWYDYAGRLLEQREHAASQKKRHRELYANKPLTQAIRERDQNRCRYCGRLVDWKDRKSPAGATYDYIDPNGPTTIENVVVACRACNAGKGRRTPEAAGYRLLPAPTKYLQISSQNQVKIKPESTPTVPNRTSTVPNSTSTSTPPPPSPTPDGVVEGAEGGDEKTEPESIPLEKRFPRYTNEQWTVIRQYWDVIRFTRKTGQVADNIVAREMDYWERFPVGIVMQALEIHIRKCQTKREEYTRGIMRRLEREAEHSGKTSNGFPGETAKGDRAETCRPDISHYVGGRYGAIFKRSLSDAEGEAGGAVPGGTSGN
ncbi:MAG: hypothetical protein HPY52_11160 [Firmicutes bacterium]|nr:hypothetical protein [Bacillota bacterium]